jgi:hypothetical protein
MATFSSIDRKYAHFPVTATLADGSAATISGVDVALLPYRTGPDASTTWTPAVYANGIATVLLAGPDADPTGALALPTGGASVWARVVDNPEVDAAMVGSISII